MKLTKTYNILAFIAEETTIADNWTSNGGIRHTVLTNSAATLRRANGSYYLEGIRLYALEDGEWKSHC